ncbi:hypothetical protein [Paenibacillus pini]|uniref:Uncharacterized protein n=1 Tax=Paenibacillus pini JCM 16418 TaxID=1236976 RepID=W7YN19_9BACL|nr:hypothetical protein [Paenibacillus pini]GAF09023.1 hypothetical protein JCM16418_3140 [Paenibacillus pini JCM 16418]
MSNELSRVKTYQKKRKKTVDHKSQQDKHQKRTKVVSATNRTSASKTLRRGEVLESGRAVAVRTELKRTKSVVGEDGRITRRRASQYQQKDTTEDTPARRDTYSSRKIRISKYFTNTLIFLFVMLTAFLVYWGIKGAPPLEELW